MDASYPTPRELVEALQQRVPGARAQLWQLLRGPVGQLMDQLRARHNLAQDRERLTVHALHSAETYLRTRPTAPFASMTWAGFRGTVLLHLAKVAFHPFGGQTGKAAGPVPLPESPDYQSQTFFLPHDRVGDFWFGGDWFAGLQHHDGSLWVIVADITGHGYYAYLLASVLPGVWQKAWEEAGSGSAQPADVLAAMHRMLEDCLPEGVYAECTLVRLSPQGEATVAPAGGSRLLVRRGDAVRADLLKLRGTWLGLSAPSAKDQRTVVLACGDELLLGTDGVFDQLDEQAGSDTWDLGDGKVPNLFDAVQRLLRQALAERPQKDDITMVMLRRRPPSSSNGPAVVVTASSSRSGAADVSV